MFRKRRKVAWLYMCLGLCAFCLCVRALLQYYESVSLRAQLRTGEYYVNTGRLDLGKFLSLPDVSWSDNYRNTTRIGRTLPDTRPSRCKRVSYSAYLPTASVIIVHRNEERSVLLTTVYSVLLRSRTDLLGEVILVDDFSDDDTVAGDLSKLAGVRYIRTKKREGLIRSRNLGCREARYPALVFLDSACEVNIDWLEPLLARLAQSPNSVVCPVNDVINKGNFLYVPQASETKGGFTWDLTIKAEKAVYQEQNYISSPVLPGSIFAVKRIRFINVGLFDQDMDDKGGEILEMSLKSWMCDGDISITPCSRVGVMETDSVPASDDSNIYVKNVRRVAEVWLDDYKRFFYFSKPSARMVPLTSVLERKTIKNQLKCKGFKWYLENIYPALRLPVTGEIAYGQIQQGSFCLDIEKGHSPAMAKLAACKEDSQRWSMSREGEISSQGMCLTADGVETHGYVLVYLCHKDKTQKWKVHKSQIYREGTSECLDSHKSEVGVVISQCDDLYQTQVWKFYPNEPVSEVKDDI